MFCLLRLWPLCWPHHGSAQSRAVAKMRSTLHRLLKPRTSLDCLPCRLASPPSSVVGPARVPVRPWREVKSHRGAPKRIPTDGFACPSRQCPYFGITDAHIHALVGDGKHGRTEPIQTFRCQACRTTFTSRRNTPLYRLKTPSHQIAMVLTAFAEGLDPSAAERVFGFRQATITTWLSRAGEHAQSLHERCFHNLHLPHLQLDELRTRLRCTKQVLWLWLAIDPCTKLVPVLHLGPRTQHAAHLFIHSLRQHLAPACLAGSSHLGHGAAVSTPAGPLGMVASVLSLCTPSPSTPSSARAATRARRQTSGATLSAANASDGSGQNASTMDDARGALLSLATGFRLSAMKITCGCGVMCWRGRGRCQQKSRMGSTPD